MNEIDELIEKFGRETFEVKDAHIKLLRKANLRWDESEFGAPAIDSKRPYGNSYVYGDIAEILEIRPLGKDRDRDEYFTIEQRDIMWDIHAGTETVLQIILATGKFELGLYERPNYSNKWRKIE